MSDIVEDDFNYDIIVCEDCGEQIEIGEHHECELEQIIDKEIT